MTTFVWTLSPRTCIGARAWSALVKKTQITAWWEYTLQINCGSECGFVYMPASRLPPPTVWRAWSRFKLNSHIIMNLSWKTASECPILILFFRMMAAVWWCAMASCRVCSGSVMAAVTQPIQVSTPSCACTMTGSTVWWTVTNPFCQLLPLQRCQTECKRCSWPGAVLWKPYKNQIFRVWPLNQFMNILQQLYMHILCSAKKQQDNLHAN